MRRVLILKSRQSEFPDARALLRRLLTRLFISTSMFILCLQCKFEVVFEVVSRLQDSTMTSKFNHFSFEFFTTSACAQLPVKTSLRALSAEAPSVLRAQQLSATLSHRCPGTLKAQRYESLPFFFPAAIPITLPPSTSDRPGLYPTYARGFYRRRSQCNQARGVAYCLHLIYMLSYPCVLVP